MNNNRCGTVGTIISGYSSWGLTKSLQLTVKGHDWSDPCYDNGLLVAQYYTGPAGLTLEIRPGQSRAFLNLCAVFSFILFKDWLGPVSDTAKNSS